MAAAQSVAARGPSSPTLGRSAGERLRDMKRWYTVTALHNLKLRSDACFEFAEGLVLTALPDWVANDSIVQNLDSRNRRALAETTHAFVAEYEAASLREPDPAWKGPQPKSIQETKYELTVLGNLALWLSRPSPVCFNVVLHAPWLGSRPFVQRLEQHSPLLCHPQDIGNTLSSEDIDFARMLHSSLALLPRDNAMWTAVRATWAALQMNMEEIRYLLFWITLEALFGPEDAREMTFRLSQRLSLFLAENPSEARDLFAHAKRGYAFRSKVAHGRWMENPEGLALMAEVETFVRRSLVVLLQDPELTKTFLGKDREAYLDDLVFSTWAHEPESSGGA